MGSGGQIWVVEATYGQWRPHMGSGGHIWVVEARYG